MSQVERHISVGSRVGLHARPAKLLAQAAAQQPAKVTIAVDGKDPVDCRSLLSILALGVEHGDTVVLAAEGDGAQASIDALAEVIATDHDDAA